MKKQFHLTSEGIREFEAELEELLSKRPAVAEAISLAREQGDLSENAEYQNAKLEQDRLEKRIKQIDHILKNVEVIKTPRKHDKVRLGSTVELKSGNKKVTFSVVGTVEADPLEGKVSDESPIGKALLGAALGEKVEIVTPAETKKYTVASIS